MENEGFVPTPTALIDEKLALLQLNPETTLYDLGCGDGRVALAAAKKYGCKVIGVEVDPIVAAKAREEVTKEGLEHLIEIREEDYKLSDFSDADKVYLYLNRGSLGGLSLKLENDLKPGAIIITHAFDLPGWTSIQEQTFKLPDGSEDLIFIYEQGAPDSIKKA